MLNRLAALAVLLWIGVPGISMAEELVPLFPFVISYDGPDNASSVAHFLDAPAGKHGFIRTENGRFVNNAGPVRLNATNITGPANFPSHNDADRLAARLARFGLNCVRLHFMDTMYGSFMEKEIKGILADDPTTQRNFDPGQVDKLDYMIAAFKKHGIYVDINLHVGRTWDERDGFPEKSKHPWADKGLDNFEPRMVELQKEYARKLLTHVNPYTGLAYTDDPCVAVVEINNENALFRSYLGGAIDNLPDPFAAELHKQWNDWLRKKYASTAALLEAWKWTPSPLCNEQIPEGKFTEPLNMDGQKWSLILGAAKASCESGGGVLKVSVTGQGNERFPKLFRRLSVKKDLPYTLSFKIRRTQGTGGEKLGMAIADTKTGWRSLGVFEQIQVESGWRTFCYSFLAADDSEKAQFWLTNFKPGVYEIDSLSFQSGVKSDFDATKRLEDGTIPTVKKGGFAPRLAVSDFYQFLVDTERKYWVGIYDFLKEELKVKPLVSGTQLSYSPPYIQAQLDYLDIHSYWRHPKAKDMLHSRTDWEVGNDAMVNSPGGTIANLAGQRVVGKGYTVSEYGHPFPNQYGAEGQPFLRAYGRLQGWDGVFEYSYNHYPDDYEPTANPWCYFDMIARTDILAHLPACASMYLRGDVQEAKSTVVGAIDYPTYFERLARTKAVSASIGSLGFDPRLSLIHKTAVDLSGKGGTDPATAEKISEDQKVFVSDTGELTWNVEQPGAGYWTVNTPNTKFFTGFPKDRKITLGAVSLTVSKTRLDWATVSLVSRKATGFGESRKPANILLAATGLSQNKGQVIRQLQGNKITLDDWGKGPVMMEGVPATITLPADPPRVKCFALDPRGDRKLQVPVNKADGGAKIVLKPEYQTVWYEIDVK
jgi:hypothetical protein